MSNDSENSVIGLSDIVSVFREYGRWMLLALAGFGLFAFLLVNFAMHSKWEAQLIIQIGQKPVLSFENQATSGTIFTLKPLLIEPSSNIAIRLEQHSFQDEVLQNLPQKERTRLMSLYSSSLNVRPILNSDLIEVKMRGYSYEEAQKLAEATLHCLQKEHELLFQNNMQLMHKQLSDLLNEAKRAEQSKNKLASSLSGARNLSSFSAVVSATLLQGQMDALNKLKQSAASLDWALQSQVLYNTRALSPVSVTTNPVAPNKLLIILAAALFGLIISILASFIHYSTRRNLLA
ncbi:MAG: hypothetical protein PHH36_12095 [Sideroxydans sp.]|nr:hypothetical protein [Sideroxydans sp.]